MCDIHGNKGEIQQLVYKVIQMDKEKLRKEIMNMVKSEDYNTGYDDICIAQEQLLDFEIKLEAIIENN